MTSPVRAALALAGVALVALGVAVGLVLGRGNEVAAVAPATPAAAAAAPGTPIDAVAAFQRVAPAVVSVRVTVGEDQFQIGSGFVVDGDGHVVTCAHVVTNSGDEPLPEKVVAHDGISVQLASGNIVDATMVGYDLFSDIAVLKVDPGTERPQPLTWATDPPIVGDEVGVVGSPFGSEQAQSMSVGIVSGLGRLIAAPSSIFSIPNMIQTDAPLNVGNSGGPLFDRNGAVLGVVAQIRRWRNTETVDAGVGFAVAAILARYAAEHIIADGRVRYGWLGARTEPITADIAQTFGLPVSEGLLVVEVATGSPAASAGITAGTGNRRYRDSFELPPDGDILLAIDGVPLTSHADLIQAVGLHPPGDTVTFEAIRDGRKEPVKVTLAERTPTVGLSG